MTYKTIRDGQPIMMSNWNINRPSERAMAIDLRARGYDTPDEERLYGSVRTIFLSNDPAYYAEDDRKYADPLILEPGEIVRLAGTALLYRVHPMRPRYEYISDIIHFDLVK